MEKQQNQSQMMVAVVYSVTLLIALVIFGLIGYFAVKGFVPGAEADSEDPTESVQITFTKSDSLTTLYTISDNQNNLISIVVAKFMPSTQKIVIIPVSPYTDCSGQRLCDIYASLGVATLKDKVGGLLGIEIQKYMTMTDTTFAEIANIMGTSIITLIDSATFYDVATDENITYNRDERLAVDGAMAVKLISYPGYSGGYATNMKLSGEIASTLINTFFSHTKNAINNVDAIFRKQYADANTNMSLDEYNQMKSAVIYVIENSSSPSYSLTPTGVWADDGTFTIDKTFISQLGGYLDE